MRIGTLVVGLLVSINSTTDTIPSIYTAFIFLSTINLNFTVHFSGTEARKISCLFVYPAATMFSS